MLKTKGVAKMKIEFAPYPDPTKQTTMRSLYRWNQELFPVDEVLAKDLQIPLKDIEIAKMNDDKGPTYRVHAYGSDGKEILSREFTVKTVSRPYNDQFPEYERVTVETGWVKLTVGTQSLLDERVESDIEMFWDHYQSQTLPKIFKIVMAQNDGRPRVEFQPLFDTLKIAYKMSEPDYQIGIEQERISSLEGLQEDTFFNTGAETGRTNWVPRGCFTSLGYLGDDEHPDSRTVTCALREKIVSDMAKTPGGP